MKISQRSIRRAKDYVVDHPHSRFARALVALGRGLRRAADVAADWAPSVSEARNDLPTIRLRSGVPEYDSPYIRARNRLGRRILRRCLHEQPEAYTIDALWEDRPTFPLGICFNVHSLCNERCVMCPYSVDEGGKSTRFMDLDLYRRLWGDFVAMGGRIATFNNFSDVFAHPRAMDYVRIALGHARDAHTYFVTNGVALKKVYVDEVFGLGWDGILYVSCHAFSAETFERVTGVNGFDHVIANTRYAASKHPHPERIVIQYCVDYSTREEIQEARTFWTTLGCSVNFFGSHTFGGNSKHRESVAAVGRLAGCTGWGYDAGQPFFQAVIQQNGNLTLCCHDLQGKVVIGDVTASRLDDVWQSDRMKKLVASIYRGTEERKGLDVCRRCNLAQIVAPRHGQSATTRASPT